MNYKLLSGCFNGEVLADSVYILDVPFASLNADIQEAIRDWSSNKRRDWVISEAQTEYERNWDMEECPEAVTLKPIPGVVFSF